MSLPPSQPAVTPRLTLLIPGLLWPNPALQDTVFDLKLPALQTLLGRGRLARRSSCGEADWWRALAGVELPAAPLRLLGLGHAPGDANWLCADPVHLRFEQQTMVLEDPAKLDLDAAESAALQQTLAPLLAEFGELHATSPGQWHLRLAGATPPCPALLSDLIGQPAKDLLPAGSAGRPWRRLFNEVQMVLHQHPVNQAREAAKKPAINSLALWGGGVLPPSAHRPPFAELLSNDAVALGIAHLLGVKAAPLPARYGAAPGHRLAVCPQLLAPTRLRDALQWREGLQMLEEAWFAPALAALNQGQLKELTVIGFGEGACLEVRSTPFDKFKFWRQAKPLTELHP